MVEHTLDFIEETRRTKPEGLWCCKCKCLWCANSRSHHKNIYSSKLTERWNRSITKSGQMGSEILMSSFPRIVVFIWTSVFFATKRDDNERLPFFDDKPSTPMTTDYRSQNWKHFKILPFLWSTKQQTSPHESAAAGFYPQTKNQTKFERKILPAPAYRKKPYNAHSTK